MSGEKELPEDEAERADFAHREARRGLRGVHTKDLYPVLDYLSDEELHHAAERMPRTDGEGQFRRAIVSAEINVRRLRAKGRENATPAASAQSDRTSA